MNNESEPKISELEALIKAFQQTHGEAELSMLLESLKTEKTFSSEEITEKQDRIIPEKISKNESETHENEHYIYPIEQKTANSGGPKKPETLDSRALRIWTFSKLFYKNVRRAFKIRVVRYATIAAIVFISIYLVFNLPLYVSRLSYSPPETQTIRTTQIVQDPSADSAALAPGEVIPVESRLLIPKIGVNAPIIFAESKVESEIQKALERGIVHYQGTAQPGEVGNSFLTGHSSNYWWATGSYNYVFVVLDKMTVGDQAIVYHNGNKFVYTVTAKKVVDPTDVSVMTPTATPTMTLMTCAPPGTSWQRLIVSLERTDPIYHQPREVVKEIEVPIEPAAKKKPSFLSRLTSIFLPN